MQSDSPPDPGTTPDNRSITDLWRDSLQLRGGARVDVVNEMYSRINAIVDQREQATIRAHAHLEPPHLEWDQQAAVFTTGRFEGWTR